MRLSTARRVARDPRRYHDHQRVAALRRLIRTGRYLDDILELAVEMRQIRLGLPPWDVAGISTRTFARAVFMPLSLAHQGEE